MLDPAGPGFAAAVGVAALIALAVGPIRSAIGYVVTLAHELGHAVAALVLGGRVRRISVHLDASGETLTLVGGRAAKLRLAVFSLAGYPTPGLVAVVAAWAVSTSDHRLFLFTIAVLTAAALVLWVRNAWGVVVSAVTVVALWLMAAEAPDAVTRTATIAGAWAFALGGLRSSWLVASGRARPRTGLDDAQRVAQLSRVVPRTVVAVGFVAVSATCVAAVAVLLLQPE